MVLELKRPEGVHFSDLIPLRYVALSYILSFVYLAIYWVNHHHLFQTVKQVNGSILWANIHLLFWLSLMPFVTAWAGENNFASLPTAIYGAVLFMASVAYYILCRELVCENGENSILSKAIGRDIKSIISAILYGIAVPLAFKFPMISVTLYNLVAIIWIMPDRRIEKQFNTKAACR
jgi:uncharacterized membrane protein